MDNLVPQQESPHGSPRDFFQQHCSLEGGVIVVEVLDTMGDIYTTAVFSDYDLAESWTEQFEDDPAIESCTFHPQFLNKPEIKGKRQLH